MKDLLLADQTRAHIDSISCQQSGSYIFHGASGLGKATAAVALAKRLNCLGDKDGACSHCRQFEAGGYADLLVVRPEDKPSITIEQVRSLIQALSLSLYYAGGTRVVLIDGAHNLTTEAQNALLKLIEEPPPATLFVLTTDHIEQLLPTVRSRCAAVYFPPLSARAAEAATSPELEQLADQTLAAGRFDRLMLARKLSDGKSDLARFARVLHDRLLARVRGGEVSAETAASSLEALELFRRQLHAKVTPKVALERLMLEL